MSSCSLTQLGFVCKTGVFDDLVEGAIIRIDSMVRGVMDDKK